MTCSALGLFLLLSAQLIITTAEIGSKEESQQIKQRDVNQYQSRNLQQIQFEIISIASDQCDPTAGDDCERKSLSLSPSLSTSPSSMGTCVDIQPPEAQFDCEYYKLKGMCSLIGQDYCAYSCQRCSPPQQMLTASPPMVTSYQNGQSNSDSALPYGGGCYTSAKGCRCDDGYRWIGAQTGPHYAGCANPSNDPQGDWCPIRDDLPCSNGVPDKSGYDYCGLVCPQKGDPTSQCQGANDFFTAWRCLNAMRTNPAAFEQLFNELTTIGICQYDSWKNSVAPRPAFTTNPELLQITYQHAQDMAQSQSLTYIFGDGATFDEKSSEASLDFEGYYDVRPQRSDLNSFSVIGMISNWMCDDEQREIIMDCGIDTFALGIAQSYSNQIYLTRVFTCQKLYNCVCI